jgi:hypothetical protein
MVLTSVTKMKKILNFLCLRTRWKFSSEAVVDMVNIHLFHDASNLISVESVPSIYVNYRKRALSYILDRISGTVYILGQYALSVYCMVY